MDIILNVACACKGMNEQCTADISDAHLRGLSISPADIVDSLLSLVWTNAPEGFPAIETGGDGPSTLGAEAWGIFGSGFIPGLNCFQEFRLNDFERFYLLSLAVAADKYESIYAFLQ